MRCSQPRSGVGPQTDKLKIAITSYSTARSMEIGATHSEESKVGVLLLEATRLRWHKPAVHQL
jgi:hypothetical protein